MKTYAADRPEGPAAVKTLPGRYSGREELLWGLDRLVLERTGD